MKPETVGRVLGVGLRVAGRMAGQRLAGSAGNAGSREQPPQRQTPVVGDPGQGTGNTWIAGGQTSSTNARVDVQATERRAGRQAGKATGNVARGLGGFVRPFKRVGGILVLEVTGVFFLLFVLVFGQMAWRMRNSYAQGPDHQKFLVAAGLVLLFLYLSVSSFWRARRK